MRQLLLTASALALSASFAAATPTMRELTKQEKAKLAGETEHKLRDP